MALSNLSLASLAILAKAALEMSPPMLVIVPSERRFENKSPTPVKLTIPLSTVAPNNT